MSNRPRLSPPASLPRQQRRIPMTPAEARDVTSILHAQRANEAKGNDLATAALKRSQIDPKTVGPVGFDIDACEWIVSPKADEAPAPPATPPPATPPTP